MSIISGDSRRVGRFFNASYPQSGSFWLKRMLLSVMEEDTNLSVNYVDSHMDTGSNPYQISKTHTVRTSGVSYMRAVFLVRHPYSCYSSILRKWKTREEFPNNADFMKIKEYHGDWGTHCRSWKNAPNILILRYEDLYDNTEIHLQKVLEWYGIPFTPDLLKEVCDANKFSDIRQLSGIAGWWDGNKFDGDIHSDISKFVNSNYLDCLEELGYDSCKEI